MEFESFRRDVGQTAENRRFGGSEPEKPDFFAENDEKRRQLGLYASNFSGNYPISLPIEAKKASLITFDEVEAQTVRSDTSKI